MINWNTNTVEGKMEIFEGNVDVLRSTLSWLQAVVDNIEDAFEKTVTVRFCKNYIIPQQEVLLKNNVLIKTKEYDKINDIHKPSQHYVLKKWSRALSAFEEFCGCADRCAEAAQNTVKGFCSCFTNEDAVRFETLYQEFTDAVTQAFTYFDNLCDIQSETDLETKFDLYIHITSEDILRYIVSNTLSWCNSSKTEMEIDEYINEIIKDINYQNAVANMIEISF